MTARVRRADKRTPEQVVIQQLTNQMTLPDRDLCQMHRRCGALPPAPEGKWWRCAWTYLSEDGSGRVVECPEPGGVAVDGSGSGVPERLHELCGPRDSGALVPEP
jgi:hypothetical protein